VLHALPRASNDFDFVYIMEILGGVRIATDWTAGLRFPIGVRFFSSPELPDWLRGSPSLLSNGYRGSFPGE
jgi:hypothetical protein